MESGCFLFFFILQVGVIWKVWVGEMLGVGCGDFLKGVRKLRRTSAVAVVCLRGVGLN